MKILNLSLDNSAINKTSALAARVVDYGSLVEKYIVVVPGQTKEEIELSEKVRVYGSGGASKITQFFYLYQMAKKLLREEKYDVITVQDQYYLALIGLKLARKYRVALEIQVHGFEKYRGLRKLIASYVLPRADAVRCVSQRLKKQLLNDFGVASEKITVAPIFNSLKITNYKLRQKNLTDKFIFLTVGRLVPVKNIALQVEAMAEIIQKYSQAELWIVGSGPEYKNLKFKIARPRPSRGEAGDNLKLSDSVKLLGQKTKEGLKEIYNQADVFLLTSNVEGWGLAVIEAAFYGLPIIMTDVGCAGEVIKNNESGLVIPVGDKKALVLAMLKLIENENLRQALAGKAYQAVFALPGKEETLRLYKLGWEKAVNNR